jgi:hypothetical protein
MRPKLIKPRGSGQGGQLAGGSRADASMTGTMTTPLDSESTVTPAASTLSLRGGLHAGAGGTVDLERRREQLTARVAELQWDLGGLVYEMAIRDRIQVDILVRRAALLQDADAELGEVERILRMEKLGTAGSCGACGAPHSSGAVYCWQCGQSLLPQVSGDQILAP